MSGSGEMEAMAARECVECGSTELAKNDEGHLVCDDCGVMCGTVEELTEDAETYDRGDGGGVNYSALRLKRVKGTGKGGKAGIRKDHDQHDRVRPPTWLETVLAFQGWLKALVSALVEHKNLSPQLDEYVSTLFHDYIQAADRGATSERWPSMSLKDKDAGRVMLSAQLALTFLYIGCLFLREAVTINDLLAWARSTSDSPFMGYWRTLPPLTREGSSIRPGRLPIASGLHKFSVNVVHLLKLDVPPVNFPLLSARFVRLLRLPPPRPPRRGAAAHAARGQRLLHGRMRNNGQPTAGSRDGLHTPSTHPPRQPSATRTRPGRPSSTRTRPFCRRTRLGSSSSTRTRPSAGPCEPSPRRTRPRRDAGGGARGSFSQERGPTPALDRA